MKDKERFARVAFKLRRYLSLERWRAFLYSRIARYRFWKSDDQLNEAWLRQGPIPTHPNGRVVVADGLWFNPGYFLRLRLFLLALTRQHPIRLVGILRHRSDFRPRRALERIGFREFIYIEDDPEIRISDFQAEATRLLADVKTHGDLLRIQLPEGVPAYIWYDTVLDQTHHGQPDLSHPAWRDHLAKMLAFIEIYRRLFRDYDVQTLALSHAWMSQFGALLWMALKRDIPGYFVTQVSEAIRIRRFRHTNDFYVPIEHLPYDQFIALPRQVREQLSAIGKKELVRRQACNTSDINIRYAYAPSKRVTDRSAARKKLGITDDRPIGVVYGHSWFDLPHLCAMENFTDFVDWFRQTIKIIRKHGHVHWFLKPHPMETWYGGQTMADIVKEEPSHLRMLSHEIDTLTVMTAADAIVTIHGTAAIEATVVGTTAVCADRSYYSDWGFAHCAKSAAHYKELLTQVGQLPPPNEHQRNLAAACFVAAYGEPHDWTPALRVPCDAGGYKMVDRIKDMVRLQSEELEREVCRIDAFLRQDQFDSFSAWTFARVAENSADAQRSDKAVPEDRAVPQLQ